MNVVSEIGQLVKGRQARHFAFFIIMNTLLKILV